MNSKTESNRRTSLLSIATLSFLVLATCLKTCHGAGQVLHESTKTDEYKSFLHKYIYDTSDPKHTKEAGSILLEELVRSIATQFPTQGHMAEFLHSVASDEKSGIKLRCRLQIMEMYEGVINLQKWAVQMLDSWGKPGPGLMYLNPVFRGEYQECLDVRAHPPFQPITPRPTTASPRRSAADNKNPMYDLRHYENLKLNSSSGSSAHAHLDSDKNLKIMKINENLNSISNNKLKEDNKNHTKFMFGQPYSERHSSRNSLEHGHESGEDLTFMQRVWALFKSSHVDDDDDDDDKRKVLFRGKYCKVGVGMPNMPIEYTELPILKIYIGTTLDVCLPDSCDADDANALVNRTLQIATFDPNQTMFVPQKSVCHEEIPLQSKSIGIMVFLVIGVMWLIYTTGYDVIMVQRPRWKLEALKQEFIEKRAALLESTETPVQSNGHSHSNGHHQVTDNGNLDNGHVINGDDLSWLISRASLNGATNASRSVEDGDDTKRPLEDILFEPPPLTKKELYLSFFSVYTNGKKILNTNLAEGTLTSLHGIRFLSMCWIILGHSMLIGMVNVENVVDFMWEMKSRTLFLIITNGFLCVDTFFVMSGMMVGYYFQGIVDHDCKWKWIVYTIHRFVRLTPAMGVFCAFYLGMWPYLGSGPNYPANAPDEDMCKEAWWYTFLYINNFLPLEKLCMMWTWYLSCDYQFYLVCPVFMVPLAKGYRKTGIAIGVLMILGTIIASGAVSYHYGMSEMLPQLMTDHGISKPIDYYNMFYQRPYCRMGPYIIGLFLGFILWHTDRKVKLPRWAVALGWITSTVAALSTLFGVHESFAGYHYMSAVEVAVYNALKHTVFGLCVAWVLFACLTGYGGFVQTILSFKAFIPLSRLTFCTYLVHPAVVYVFSYSQNGVFWLNSWNLSFHYLGVLFLSIVVGGTLSVFVESPTIRIEREILIQLDLVPPSANF